MTDHNGLRVLGLVALVGAIMVAAITLSTFQPVLPEYRTGLTDSFRYHHESE